MKTTPSCVFGEHLTLDGYQGVYAKLDSPELVAECLRQLPDKLGMTRISDEHVVFAEGNDSKDPGGWSGYVLLAESHMSLHTFPGRGFLSADVYTCKEGMDIQSIISYLTRLFELKDVEINLIKRGTRYPVHNTQVPEVTR